MRQPNPFNLILGIITCFTSGSGFAGLIKLDNSPAAHVSGLTSVSLGWVCGTAFMYGVFLLLGYTLSIRK
jgi:hypothetical protein